MMKIAFSTSGESLDAPLDARFGRAPKFLLYDLDSGLAQLVDNEVSRASSQGPETKAPGSGAVGDPGATAGRRSAGASSAARRTRETRIGTSGPG